MLPFAHIVPLDLEKSAQQLFLQHLKEATMPQHEALERHPSAAALVGPALTTAQYLNILQRFHGIVLPIEEQVYPLLINVLANADQLKRGDLLRADLAALGMSPAAIGALPRLTALPTVRNIAEAFGTAYVLEGSKLGGQFIARHVGSVLGISPENGLRFFSGHGRETGPVWNEFRWAMADFAVSSGQQAPIIAAAARTFDAFKAWLERTGGLL